MVAWCCSKNGCVATRFDPGGLDPSIVENTQVLQFAVHVKQRVPFAEQVASVESLCAASLLKHVKTHLFGQCASRQRAGKYSLQLRRSTCWIKVEAHLCICIYLHIHVLLSCITCAFTHVLYTAHEIERPLSYGLRLRGEAPIALVSGPSETSIYCGFVVSAQVGSELESWKVEIPQVRSIWPTPRIGIESSKKLFVSLSNELRI